MGFNNVGNLRLEGNQQVTVAFWFGDREDVGAQYFAANPIGVFPSNGGISNAGSVAMVDQQKSKVWLSDRVETVYLVTVRNLAGSGVECDFDGGGF